MNAVYSSETVECFVANCLCSVSASKLFKFIIHNILSNVYRYPSPLQFNRALLKRGNCFWYFFYDLITKIPILVTKIPTLVTNFPILITKCRFEFSDFGHDFPILVTKFPILVTKFPILVFRIISH